MSRGRAEPTPPEPGEPSGAPATRTAPADARRRRSVPLPWLALAALLAAACAGHWAWIAHDSVPLATDAYRYMANLLAFDNGFPWGGSPSDAWRALGRLSHGGRPPLVQLASWPIVVLGGRGEDALQVANLAILALLAVAVYRLGSRVAGRWPGVLAAALAIGYPPMIHLSRGYLPHLAAAAAAAVSLDLLIGLLDRRSPRRALAFGASLGIGMLIHPSFLWALAAPAAGVGLWLALARPAAGSRAGLAPAHAAGGDSIAAPAPAEGGGSRPALPARGRAGSLARLGGWLGARLRDPFLWRGLVPGAALAAALAAPWYLTWGRKLMRVQAMLQSEELEALRGARWRSAGYHDVEPSLGWYAATAPDALSWLLLAPTLLGLAVCLARPRRSPGALVLAFALAGAYLLLALQSTLAWLYPPVILPAAAALGAYGVAALRPRPLAAAAGGLGVAAAAFVFAFVSWGWGRPVALALGALDVPTRSCRFHRGFCAAPPETPPRPVAEALAVVLDDPRCAGKPPCRLLAVYGAGLGSTLYRHALAERWPGRRLTVYAQHDASWGTPFPLENLLESDYVAWVDPGHDPPPNPSQLYRTALTRLLRSPPATWAASHEVAAELPLEGISRLVLLRRTAPPTAEEAEAVAAALAGFGIDERLLGERGPVVENLRRSARD